MGATQLGNGSPGGLGVTALLVPITFGVVHTLVLAAGELTWPRPEGEVRRARLVHRGLLDAAPRWLVRSAAVAVALAAVTLVGGALLADSDGRSFSYGDPFRGGLGTASPFPGAFYGVPGRRRPARPGPRRRRSRCWIVANRPAVATEDEGIETALRRASAHRVLRVARRSAVRHRRPALHRRSGAALGGAAGAASGLLDAAGAATSLIGGAAMLAGVVVACIRAPGVPADAPAVPAR